MPSRMAEVYRQLVEEIQSHSEDGAFIYATPDCPEVYFLAARRNPTGTFFDFFEDDFHDPEARSRRLLTLLDDKSVDLVVSKSDAQFSAGVPEALAREVAIRYPQRIEVYPYRIYWRSAANRRSHGTAAAMSWRLPDFVQNE